MYTNISQQKCTYQTGNNRQRDTQLSASINAYPQISRHTNCIVPLHYWFVFLYVIAVTATWMSAGCRNVQKHIQCSGNVKRWRSAVSFLIRFAIRNGMTLNSLLLFSPTDEQKVLHMKYVYFFL